VLVGSIKSTSLTLCFAVLWCAQDAVLVGHLKSATYQRLMVAVIAKSTLYLGAFLLVSKALHMTLRRGWRCP
jgi:hypothetical protein